MLDLNKVYISKEEPKEENQRNEIIRFKNPNKKIVFEDIIRGHIEFDTTELGDFVVAKSMSEPLYHLAAVVDDHEMGVTHIIRGEEHLSNTPRQMLIQEAIEAKQPLYAHIPLILASDRSKLSKRAGAVSVLEYKKRGFLPEALDNYMALLGWNPGTEQEIFKLEELIKVFDIAKIHKSGAIFDEKKLEWVNKEHIKFLPEEERKKMILESIRGELYFEQEPELDVLKISWKNNPKDKTAQLLEGAIKIIAEGGDLMSYAEREGRGDVLWPVRYALTGLDVSPDPFILLDILGKGKSLKRLENAVMILKK